MGLFNCALCPKGACRSDELLCPVCRKSFNECLFPRSYPRSNLGELPLLSAGSLEGGLKAWVKLLKSQPAGIPLRDHDLFLSRLIDHWVPELASLRPLGLVPVPSHPIRAFLSLDLSSRICSQFSLSLRVPMLNRVLHRPLSSAWMSPAHRSRRSRKDRYEQAFHRLYRAKKMQAATIRHLTELHPRVALIDDVCTSGASLKACQAILERQGFEVVGAFVLAQAPAPRRVLAQ